MLPSLKEGWPISVMEAGQARVPSVVTDAPGLRDVVIDGRTGFLFARDDAAAMVDRIVSLLTDRELRERMTEAAFRWAEAFTWDRASLDVEQSLGWCLEAQASGRVPLLRTP